MQEDAYLWSAEFNNGKIITQKESGQLRSFNDDILPKAKDLKFFSLKGDQHNITIDMDIGAFNIDGFWIGKGDLRFSRYVEEEYPILRHDITVPGNTVVKGCDIRPIFGRRTTRIMDLTLRQELEHYYVYFIGWEATVITSEIGKVKCLQCDKIMPVEDRGSHILDFFEHTVIDYQYREVTKTTKHIVYVHPDGLIVFA